MNSVPFTIQIISILVSFGFLAYIGRLIIKGKLREEYSFIWVFGTIVLIVFSFWSNGLELIAKLLGVQLASNLIFMAAILVIFIYLLHLSVVISRLQSNNKELSQKIALIENKLNKISSEETTTDKKDE